MSMNTSPCYDNKWTNEQKEEVKHMFEMGATLTEVAPLMGISKTTLKWWLRSDWGKLLRVEGDGRGKLALREKLHEMALQGDKQALIHLSKARLGNNEKQVIEEVTKEKPTINIKFVGDE